MFDELYPEIEAERALEVQKCCALGRTLIASLQLFLAAEPLDTPRLMQLPWADLMGVLHLEMLAAAAHAKGRRAAVWALGRTCLAAGAMVSAILRLFESQGAEITVVLDRRQWDEAAEYVADEAIPQICRRLFLLYLHQLRESANSELDEFYLSYVLPRVREPRFLADLDPETLASGAAEELKLIFGIYPGHLAASHAARLLPAQADVLSDIAQRAVAECSGAH